MKERITNLPKQLLGFWNKYSNKQKTLIVTVIGVVILTLIILGFAMSRPKYVTVTTFEDTAQSAQAKTALTDAGIQPKFSDDGLTLQVEKEQVASSRMILGENGIQSTTPQYSMKDALSASFSETQAISDRKYKMAFEDKLAQTIRTGIVGIKNASVSINLPEASNTIYEEDKEAYASVLLSTSKDFSKDSAAGIATYLATTLGTTDTDNVRIMDQNGTILFSGEAGGDSASTTYDVTTRVTEEVSLKVRNILMKSGIYNDVEVAPSLVVDQDQQSITDHQFYTEEGKNTGPIKRQSESEDINQAGGNGGAPGTDTNGGTGYNMQNGDTQNSSSTTKDTEYNTSEKTTITQKALGSIVKDQSSIAISLNQYKIYDETTLKKQGQLKGITFEEFKLANSAKNPLTVDPTTYTLVEKATGLSQDNITIVAYEVPIFYGADISTRNIGTILQIALVILIAGLLLFVVIKGMKPVEITEMEPELSVEALLATTKENQNQPLEDVDFNDKSTTRQQIEKFVGENPDAVANLLRNWLNEE